MKQILHTVQRKAILIGMAALVALSLVLFLPESNVFFVASIIFFGGWLIQVPGNIVIGLQLRLLWLFFRQSGGRLPVAPCAADVEVPLPGHYLGHIGQKSGKTLAKLGQNSQMCGFLQWALAKSRKGECPLFCGNACQTGLASAQHIVYSSHLIHCTGLR